MPLCEIPSRARKKNARQRRAARVTRTNSLAAQPLFPRSRRQVPDTKSKSRNQPRFGREDCDGRPRASAFRAICSPPSATLRRQATTLSPIQAFPFSALLLSPSFAKKRKKKKAKRGWERAAATGGVGKLSITFTWRVGVYPDTLLARPSSPLSPYPPGDQVHLITGNGVVF